MRVLLWLLLWLCPAADLWALPESVRHSYINCNTCHFSPGGGGALNAYGRALSQELFASYKADEKSFYGKLPPSLQKLNEEDKLVVAAFLRGLQFYKAAPTYTEARLIPMQADLELGYNRERFALVGTLGQQSIRTAEKRSSHTFSRRHYALYRAGEHHQFRGGRFLRPFGLQDPDHTLYVRKDLNFGFDSETYNAEYAFQTENVNLLLNYSFGNFQNRFARTEERGLTLSGSRLLGEKSKIGASFFMGRDPLTERLAAGPWSIISYGDAVFSSVEGDWQSSRARASASAAPGSLVRSYSLSHKLHWEVYKGVLPFLLMQAANANLKMSSTKKQSFGFGVQWFVAPHLELQAELQREFLYTVGKPKTDLAFLTGHWYL